MDTEAGAARFTSETMLAVPVEEESTTVVRFDADSIEPERTVAMCPPRSP